MKNRCIVAKFEDNVRFICLGETDSIVVTNTPNSIILFSLHGDDSFTLKTFSNSEREIKDIFYSRLCSYIQAGEFVAYGEDTSVFNVEDQIQLIKCRLENAKQNK